VRNERGVRDGFGEAVHQMRIGLRRLRAGLSIFKGVLGRAQLDTLRPELVWLTEQLGEVREYDVLIGSMRKLQQSARSAFVGASELSDELAGRRRQAFARASAAVASTRFQRLIVSSTIALILRADEQGAGDRLARDLARKVLEHRTKRVLRRLARFARLGVRERHELRIEVKKLRYGAEFFATLFPNSNRSRKRFTRALSALQDVLGNLNDSAVHRRIAADLVEDGPEQAGASRRIAFAMGRLTENEQIEARSLIARVPMFATRLSVAPRFWR
jgi:CHAD domain-containing protein